MGYWLAPPGSARTLGTVKRFDARYWSVDFPRPMMASVVTTGPESLRAEAIFYRANDLAGLIWEAEDRHDHPLLRYQTSRDFRRCTLSFRWRSGGVVALDAVHGPTLTIVGRDRSGASRSWYVRLWNYAVGGPDDAAVTLDFDAICGGWAGDDPVFAGDVDRMFVSLVPPGYSGEDEPLTAISAGWVELSGITCKGSGSVLAIGDALLPEHELRIATAYDDLYHLTPARIIRNVVWLGYRGTINHYVGMSHYFRLRPDLKVTGSINDPCAAWHRSLLENAKIFGIEIILSLSFELLASHCPAEWMQRDLNGAPALTGWEPPSALLSPASESAMGYLTGVALAFAALAAEAGQRVRLQIGEPWWWVTNDGAICLYDDGALAAFAPVPIPDLRTPLDAAQRATLDAAGECLAAATAGIVEAVKSQHPAAETLLLLYLPTVFDPATPDAERANAPPGWAWPAFDVLQAEAYEWVTSGRAATAARVRGVLAARLGYSPERQHYLSGFVADADQAAQWRSIIADAQGAQTGVAEIFLWALPQVLRDGFTYFRGDAEMQPFDDVLFPIAIGADASVEAAFSTTIVTSASGAEQRNSAWADARLRFDAGPGLRSEDDLQALIAFFRARRGPAVAFRFEDPIDHSSNPTGGGPLGGDQLIGRGDGQRCEFALVKRYGDQVRRITRPRAGTMRVSIDGDETTAWSLGPLGRVLFDDAPPPGAEVRAGFLFDVPVRFGEDRLGVSLATFRAGEIPSVPLIEVREEVA